MGEIVLTQIITIMKRTWLFISVTLFILTIVSCGSSSESDKKTTESSEEEVIKADPLKTAEELTQCEKFDEKEIAEAENKDEIIRFSSSYNLTEFPEEVLKARNLQTIELNNYQGTSLPADLVNLQNLSNIYISGANFMAILPDFLPKLKNLKTLSITNAKFLNLNEAFKIISKCENLEYVQINGCDVLYEIPAEIGNMKKLKVLDISHNKISSIPEEFYTLPSLNKLIINCYESSSYNFDELFANMKSLPNLNTLTFQYCGFTELPEVLNDYTALETVYWREEGKGWENSDAILKTVENMGKKFPNITVSWNAYGTMFYDYN